MWNERPLLPLRHTQEIMIPFYPQGKEMEPREYKSNVPKPTQSIQKEMETKVPPAPRRLEYLIDNKINLVAK